MDREAASSKALFTKTRSRSLTFHLDGLDYVLGLSVSHYLQNIIGNSFLKPFVLL